VHAVRHFRRRRDDSGAAAVEFSILLIPFVVLCFGMISAAIMLNDKLSLTQGVREAARYGATYPYDPTNSYTFLDAIRTTASADSFGQIGDATPTYCVGFWPASENSLSGSSYYYVRSGDTATQTGSCPGMTTLPRGGVVVVGWKDAQIDLVVSQLGLTFSSTSVARYEGVS
jgi:Flp pilus assembly pilin Flp